MAAFSTFMHASRQASPPLAPSAPDEVTLEELGGRIFAKLGSIRVAEIGVHPAGGFAWICRLPESRTTLQRAADVDKAKSAVRYAVREWMAAAGLVTSMAAIAKLEKAERLARK